MFSFKLSIAATGLLASAPASCDAIKVRAAPAVSEYDFTNLIMPTLRIICNRDQKKYGRDTNRFAIRNKSDLEVAKIIREYVNGGVTVGAREGQFTTEDAGTIVRKKLSDDKFLLPIIGLYKFSIMNNQALVGMLERLVHMPFDSEYNMTQMDSGRRSCYCKLLAEQQTNFKEQQTKSSQQSTPSAKPTIPTEWVKKQQELKGKSDQTAMKMIQTARILEQTAQEFLNSNNLNLMPLR